MKLLKSKVSQDYVYFKIGSRRGQTAIYRNYLFSSGGTETVNEFNVRRNSIHKSPEILKCISSEFIKFV